MQARRIGIIGGGAAGAAIVGELLRNGRGLALTWIVGHGAPGRGVAYATANERHLLNVRAGATGLFVDAPGALLRFAQERGLAAEAADFLPRRVFGEFVGATLARAIATAHGSNSLELRPLEATAIKPGDAGILVLTEDGAQVTFEAAVLAIGAPPPVPLAQVSAVALSSGRYALDPWSLPSLQPAPQRVLVIGSGLTAIDAMLGAAAQWPDAQILAVSRHGRLPATHHARSTPACAVPGKLIAELRAHSRVRHWFQQIRMAAAAADDWRSVIDGLRGATPTLWQSLPVNEQRRFLRHARWAWEIARHRVAPQAAQAIELLRDAGRLEILAGRVLAVDGSGPLHVTLRRRDDGSVDTCAADLVIQATGFQGFAHETAHGVLRQMLDAGLVRPDRLSLGLDADAQGRPLRSDGLPWLNLHAVGALLRGAQWECTALREISAAAASLARELIGVPAEDPAAAPPGLRSAPSRHNDISIRQFGA